MFKRPLSSARQVRIVCEIYDVLYYNLVSRACEVWLKRSGWCIAKCATPYLGYAARSPSDSFNITTEIYTYSVYIPELTLN